MIDGIINVYKEQGYTSFDVVAKLRGILKQKKIGHTGTLDPMAEGVLLVCLGKATRLVDMLTAGTKEYRAIMRLGLTTDTEDITGSIISQNGITEALTESLVTSAVQSFVGQYDQIPPMYSAIKQNGKKLYEYARQGIEVERKPRKVEIYSIENINVDLPDVQFDVHCSKGTYIRSLCRDIGDKLGCGAALAGLVRQEVHGYRLDEALRLSEIEKLLEEGRLDPHIIPVDALLQQYSACHIKKEYAKGLLNGNKLAEKCLQDAPAEISDQSVIRIYLQDDFLALYQYCAADKQYKPYKMFLN